MEHLMRAFHCEPMSSEDLFADQEIQRCPFLRNINEPTNFSFSSNSNFPLPIRGTKGPIFEDGPNFDMAFRLFHGRDGVVPLSRGSSTLNENPEPEPALQFNPLAAKAASISLSAFGPGGPFSCDYFSNKCKKLKNPSKKESSTPPIRGTKGPIFEDGPNFDMAFRLFHGRDGVVPLSRGSSTLNENPEPEPALPLAAEATSIRFSAFGPGGSVSCDYFSNKWNSSKKESSTQKGGNSSHESLSNEWLQTGQCPLAKSYRAVSGVLPLVAKALQPPPGVKFRCPPAVVAAHAALAQTAFVAFVRNLRPQPLSDKMLASTLLGVPAKIPLGMWMDHTKKFSPQWFATVLRESVLMPKSAMAITVAASILGQPIGFRVEWYRLKTLAASAKDSGKSTALILISLGAGMGTAALMKVEFGLQAIGSSAGEEPTGNVCL